MVAQREEECTSAIRMTYVPPKVVFDLGFPYNRLLRAKLGSLRLFWIDLRPTSPAEQKGRE
jgi:hypothetical protein